MDIADLLTGEAVANIPSILRDGYISQDLLDYENLELTIAGVEAWKTLEAICDIHSAKIRRGR